MHTINKNYTCPLVVHRQPHCFELHGSSHHHCGRWQAPHSTVSGQVLEEANIGVQPHAQEVKSHTRASYPGLSGYGAHMY